MIKEILDSEKFRLTDVFFDENFVQILETNFESMRVMMCYGNFKTEVSVIYTEIDERIFEVDKAKKGSFGVVRFEKFEERKYAIKGLRVEYDDDGINLKSVYTEYFLALMASVLKIGPKIFSLFGYDILVTKNMAFFAM